MYHVGVDLHKETSWFFIIDSNGKKVDSKNILNEPEILRKYFEQIPKPFVLAVEATYNWYYFVDLAQEYAKEVVQSRGDLTPFSCFLEPLFPCNQATIAFRRVPELAT